MKQLPLEKKAAGGLKSTFFSLDIVDILMRIKTGTCCSFIVLQVMDLLFSTIRHRQTTIPVVEI